MNVDRCLERIGYRGSRDPTLQTLRDLKLAFLLSVPFENLDIHLGREITLSSEKIYEKIVLKRRGGFCYECNTLFADLLRKLGFQVDYLSARMVLGSTVNPEFDHMVLRVTLDGDYLVDVGNGQSCREPLPMDRKSTAASEGFRYRVGTHNGDLALYFRYSEGEWALRFLFTIIPREPSDFEERCRYHQTSPDAPFTQHRLATMATQEGRVQLLDKQLSITEGSRRREEELDSDEACREALVQYFGIRIA